MLHDPKRICCVERQPVSLFWRLLRDGRRIDHQLAGTREECVCLRQVAKPSPPLGRIAGHFEPQDALLIGFDACLQGAIPTRLAEVPPSGSRGRGRRLGFPLPSIRWAERRA